MERRNRSGVIYGAIALVVMLVGGVTYYLVGDCDWPLTREVCSEIAQPQFDRCDIRNPAYDSQECEQAPPVCEGPDCGGDIVQPIVDPYKPRVVSHTPLFGNSCDDVAEALLSQENPADCNDVFFLTNRTPVEKNQYGSEFSDQMRFGKAIVATPVIIAEDDPVRFVNKTSLWGRIKLLNPFKSVDDYEFEFIDEEEYAIKTRSVRQTDKSCDESALENERTCEKSDWLGLTTVSEIQDADLLTDADLFYQELNTIVNANSNGGRIFLYIHGFDTTFRESLVTSGNLNADLDINKIATRNSDGKYPFGVPVVFSWPTLTRSDSDNDDLTEDDFEAYIRSQVRAIASSKYLSNFIMSLSSQTNVKEINILAHSMGNRVLLEALEHVANSQEQKLRDDIKIRFVNSAGDVEYNEYRDKMGAFLDKIPDTQKRNIDMNIYVAKGDHALFFSALIQDGKRGRGFFDIENFDEAAQDRILAEIRKHNINEEQFFGEGSCRIGKQWPCKSFVFDYPRAFTIDATGFGSDVAGHGYYANSPMVLADTGCALIGSRPPKGDRPLEQDSRRESWRLNPNGFGTDDCKVSGRKILYRIKEKDKQAEPVELIVFFKLMKPSLETSEVDRLQKFVKAALENDIVSASVIAHTDTAGEFGYNDDLAARRAETVRSYLESFGVPGNLISVQSFGESQPIVNTGDGVREKQNRRVMIRIEFR